MHSEHTVLACSRVRFCAGFSPTSPTSFGSAACWTRKKASSTPLCDGHANRPDEARKRPKIIAIVDRNGLPLSVSRHAANHHEVRLVQLCFDFFMIEAKPENLIGDRAYDSESLDEQLRQDGIEMIAPHRCNRSKPATPNERRLRRYARRWPVERFFA